jgi:polar amino acid transport system substrate-binding protein
VILILFSQSSHANNYSVGWQLWYPYQYHSVSGIQGFDVEITKAIFEQIEQPVEFVELPWKRHLRYLVSGKIDVAMGATKSVARNQYAQFSIPYRKESINVYVLKNKPIKLSELKHLINSNYSLAVEQGYYYGEQYEQLLLNPKFVSKLTFTPTIEHSVKLLMNGDVDAVLADCLAMNAFTLKYKIKNDIAKLQTQVYEADIHFMISNKSKLKHQVNAINKAISNIRKAGRFQQIMNTSGCNNSGYTPKMVAL